MRRRRQLGLLASLLVVCPGSMVLGACGSDDPGPLVGSWVEVATGAAAPTGMSMRYTFNSDGELAIRWARPQRADTVLAAEYTMQWDSVLTLSDARGSEQFIAVVVADTLTLRTDAGIVRHYFRTTD